MSDYEPGPSNAHAEAIRAADAVLAKPRAEWTDDDWRLLIAAEYASYNLTDASTDQIPDDVDEVGEGLRSQWRETLPGVLRYNLKHLRGVRRVRHEMSWEDAVKIAASQSISWWVVDEWPPTWRELLNEYEDDDAAPEIANLAWQTIYEAVNREIETDNGSDSNENPLSDWLHNGSWQGDETPEAVAAEWDELQRDSEQ